MTKKILFGIWMAVFILAGIFGVSSARSRSDSFRGDAASFACNVRSQIAGETVGEDENLTMPEAVSGTVSAYLKTTIRTVKPGGIALREQVRRRSSRLLWFAALFCTVLKRMLCGPQSAFLCICMIFVSFFQVCMDALYRGDGKKRYASIYL